VLVTTAGWRWVFLVNVPVGIVVIAGAYGLLPGVVPGRRHHLDIGGIVLASSGLLAVVFGLVEGQRFAWGTITGPITIPAVMAAGGVLLAAWVAGRVAIKFILMGARLLAAVGVGWLVASVSTTATAATFIPPLVVTGAGLGCGFAVVMTVGMRGIAPQVAGAASGVLNTF